MNKIIKKLLILPFLIPFTLFASTTKPQTQADSLPESTTSALIQLESAMKENLDLINNDSEVYKPSIDDRLNDIYNAMVDNIINSASNFIGTPYRRGAKGPKSFDCSGFTSYIFAREGINLSQTSRTQITDGRKIERKEEVQKGDLIFFKGSNASNKTIGHVGIVTENDNSGNIKFIHSATSVGVKVSEINEPYYSRRFIAAVRVDLNL